MAPDRPGRNGRLFRPGDPADLAAQLDALAAAPERLRDLGRQSRAITRQHDRRLTVSRYEALHEALVGAIFEIQFTYIQVVVLGAVCVWCAAYGISLIARFAIALWVWVHHDRYERVLA